MKYRKKPIVIEAFRWTGDETQTEDPAWAVEAIKDGRLKIERDQVDGRLVAFINTPEGKMRGEVGDWIIKGVKNEIYPCRNDIFQVTYEAVE